MSDNKPTPLSRPATDNFTLGIKVIYILGLLYLVLEVQDQPTFFYIVCWIILGFHIWDFIRTLTYLAINGRKVK